MGKNYIKAMESRLPEDKMDMLKRIYEPVVVEVPMNDSRSDVCVLPDGEIRSYGKLYAEKHFGSVEGQMAYLSSTDCGLSWEIRYAHGKMHACSYIEKGDVYIRAFDGIEALEAIEDGLYVALSHIGPDDKDPEVTKLCEGKFCCTTLPLQSEFSDRIWFTTQMEGRIPMFFYSDDLGKTWIKRELECPHCYETVFPNKGMRWSWKSGVEPTVCEISEKELLMTIRTPMDCFYKSYSKDGGDTWSTPEPTDFYGTNTTSHLLKLSDGRVLHFWNNTKPLAQINRAKDDTLSDIVKIGYSEVAFTNRDAAHVAISEDGCKSFIGYREFLLNPIRNNADFRYTGSPISSGDKSVHQFQAFELPFNKVLVSAGQNEKARRLVIFDVNWLYETERKENFLSGIGDITTHTYTKSVSDCHLYDIGNGHCSWNRAMCAYPVPDPEGSFNEVLSVSKHHDDRMINDIGGMCWNFPMSKSGRVSVEIKIAEKEATFILADRWYNACDPYAASQAQFWFSLDSIDVGDGYAKIDIDFDTQTQMATVLINGEFIFKVKMTNPCTTGISYLIMQCATDGDSKGFYIKSLAKNAN